MSFLNITGRLELSFTGTEILTIDGTPYTIRPDIITSQSIVNGLVAVSDGWDAYYPDTQRTLTASASRTYTLSALTDTAQRVIAFTKVRLLILVVTSRTAGDYLTLGPGNTHGWIAMVPADEKVYLCYAKVVDKTDSFPVVSGVTDQLTVTNSGSSSITYDLLIGGNSG